MARRKPLVSVVVPAWNAADTLLETLRSVAEQTYDKLEILIVDDGSTDATATIAEAFCAAEPRARLIRQENAGVAAARNAAIERAQGEWVAPIDADDLWHPLKIERQVAAALAAPETPGFVYCWYRVIDRAAKIIGSGPHWAFNGRAFEQIAYRNPVQNGSSLLILKAAAERVGGYDAGLRANAAQGCEDVMIQLRIAREFPVAAVPEFLVGYRVVPDRMSDDGQQMLRSWRMVYDRINGETPLPPRVMRWYEADLSRTLADQRLARRDFGGALPHLSRALWLDPVRWAPYLAYRAARIFRSRASGTGVAFKEADPRVRIGAAAERPAVLAELLRRIDARRLRGLGR